MSKTTSSAWLAAAGLTLLSGCQTWNMEAGMTLPSAHYLSHPAQYFAPSPPFPLTKEQNSLEEAHRKYLEESGGGGGG